MKRQKDELSFDKELDFIKIISILYVNRLFLIKNILISIFIGFFVSILIPKVYKSSSTFYPHYDNSENVNGNIRNLAGLAGFDLQSENSQIIPPNLYPSLISSSTFKLEILDELVIYENERMTYRDYLTNDLNSLNLFYIIQLPLRIFSSLKSLFISDNTIIENDILKYISDDDYDLFEIIEDNIILDVNEDDGFIDISVYDKNPEVSAIITIKSNEILQKSIIEFKLKNINDIYDFTSNQVEIARNILFQIQDSLANFRDSNLNIKSDLFLNQLDRLETEYNISKNIYNELAITKEKTAIDVRKNTPIFTIINPVVVANEEEFPNKILVIIIFGLFGLFICLVSILLKSSLIRVYNQIIK
tara:strand:+ start:3172 stop:4254 length:1083 start_codon:yes stop_codon:yes gene_type:complete